MRKRTAVACLGLSVIFGTGIGLVVRSQVVVGAKVAKGAIITLEREPSEIREQTATARSEQKPGEWQSRGDGDGRVKPTAVGSSVFAELRLPPVPSRVLPAPAPNSYRAAPRGQEQPLPSPPAPSKVLPDTVRGRLPEKPSPFDETDAPS
jgi:hypothetical protein